MPTCLSIRFYPHRDTVDSTFASHEQIEALRSQNITFIIIYKACECGFVCVFLPLTHKRLGMWAIDEIKTAACWSQHDRIYTFLSPCICSWVLMLLALRELLNTLRSVGVAFQKKERRSNINTEPLCYQQSQLVRQRASPPLQKWSGFHNTDSQWGWMNVGKCQPFRDLKIKLYF